MANITAKSNDCNFVSIGEKEIDGYLPQDMGIGAGDYVEFCWCLDCGKIQGQFPKPVTELEKPKQEEE